MQDPVWVPIPNSHLALGALGTPMAVPKPQPRPIPSGPSTPANGPIIISDDEDEDEVPAGLKDSGVSVWCVVCGVRRGGRGGPLRRSHGRQPYSRSGLQRNGLLVPIH